MKFKSILLILIGIFLLVGMFIYVEPSITGLATQERFMISDVKVSAQEFDQEIKVEQFDEHEIKFDNALYYFTIKPEYEQDINYVLIEFIADSSQVKDYDAGLYLYKDGWLKLDSEFVKQDGRFLYYKSKSENFGLFAVGLSGKAEEKMNKNDLLLFALLPIFIIILLFSALCYGFVEIIQKINYRFYLVFKKIIFGLLKFGLSFGIVIMILDLISPNYGGAGQVNLIYYAVIPLVILTLLSDIILNFILYVHRLIEYNKVYKFSRNLILLFALGFVWIVGLLNNYVPKIEGSLTRSEVLIYGLIPVVLMTFGFVFVFYVLYVLVKKIAVRV